MRKIQFNKDFSKNNTDYVFSWEMMKLHYESMNKQVNHLIDWKKYDGYSVIPYDVDSRLYGKYGLLDGWDVPPQWCLAIPIKSCFTTQRYQKIVKRRHRRPYQRPTR